MGEEGSNYQLAEYFRMLPSRFKPGRVDRELLFYFEIEDEKWTVRVGPDGCQVAEGSSEEKQDCYLKTTKAILVDTIRGEYTPTFSDLISGKVKTNRPDLLALFKQVFID